MQASTSARVKRAPLKPDVGGFFRFLPRLALDWLLIGAAFGLALLLKFDASVPAPYPARFLQALPVILTLFTLALIAFGIHEHLWQFAGMSDVTRLWGATAVATAVCLLADISLLMDDGIYALPLSVVVTGGIFSAIALTGSRIWRRIVATGVRDAEPESNAQRVLIVGCGSAGRLLAVELRQHRRQSYSLVGFVDDDRAKLGKVVHRTRVLGTIADLPALLAAYAVDVVAVAIPSQPGLLREIVRLCRDTNVKVQNVPGLAEIIEGRATVDALREVTIEDLLRRDEVHLDNSAVAGHFRGKTVLVTGAAGSIGSELCRQLLPFGPARLVGLDTNETGLFDLEHELRPALGTCLFTPVIADVTDPAQLSRVFADHAPEIVFHAAAYKHVPLMELHPHQALRVNVLGTDNLCRAAAGRAEQVVLISTDKAVQPKNVMGCTKRLAEYILAAWNERSTTRYSAVRFGNVLGSRGSVVPLFRAQIEAGGPVTVTDPNATRYFMTIREAARLVIEAATLEEGASLLVLDMGEPVRILDLAQDLITLSGRRVGRDIQIVFTGLRPGEKEHEALFNPEEAHTRTRNRQIFSSSLSRPDAAALDTLLTELRSGLLDLTPDQIRRRLADVIPEYAHVEVGGP